MMPSGGRVRIRNNNKIKASAYFTHSRDEMKDACNRVKKSECGLADEGERRGVTQKQKVFQDKMCVSLTEIYYTADKPICNATIQIKLEK